jgi:glycosyltransferase involved in cell wall biosynthesis
MKRRILILFPDEWLSHSPTVLNLLKTLRTDFDVTVLAIDDGTFRNCDLRDNALVFIQVPPLLARGLMRRVRVLYDAVKAALLFIRLATSRNFRSMEEVIAVDSVGLWVAQRVFSKCHFLSLEVKRDLFFQMCSPERIRSVAIQTPERLSMLMPGRKPHTFFIQNAPSLAGNNIDRNRKSKFDGSLLFFGNILPSHGIYTILEAFEASASLGYSLTIKGIIYKRPVRRYLTQRYAELFKRRKIILDETYTPQDEIIDYLAKYSIGFCIYDFSRISSNDFNYISSPSGKLFNYYAAGVPVIGTDVLGLNSIRQFRTGVLIRELSPKSICEGICRIAEDYGDFSRNCIRAARHFDFEEASAPYKQFIGSPAKG